MIKSLIVFLILIPAFALAYPTQKMFFYGAGKWKNPTNQTSGDEKIILLIELDAEGVKHTLHRIEPSRKANVSRDEIRLKGAAPGKGIFRSFNKDALKDPVVVNLKGDNNVYGGFSGEFLQPNASLIKLDMAVKPKVVNIKGTRFMADKKTLVIEFFIDGTEITEKQYASIHNSLSVDPELIPFKPSEKAK